MLATAKPSSAFAEPDEYFSDMVDLDLEDLYASAEPLLSEDIWKKFALDDPVEDLLEDLDVAAIPDLADIDLKELCKILNHDCMWAGHCGSKEHSSDAKRPLLQGIVPLMPPLLDVKPPYATALPKQNNNRSLLLKTQQTKVASNPVVSPDSPPISDDEDSKGQTQTLKMLNDAIDACDIEEDSDLCEYFGEDGDFLPEDDDFLPEDDFEEEEEEEEEEDDEDRKETPPPQPKPVFQPTFDHSYHKDKNASMRMANLGIETPSDSEEEIDVVSLGEKGRLYHGLPNNPSVLYQEHLERTVQCAISKNRSPGIKTLPPIRKYACLQRYTPLHSVKREPTTPPSGSSPRKQRGAPKRARYYHHRPAHPYKRRSATTTSPNSDSEPELEKRSLHNNMERKRRIDLRNAFDDLRKLVPKLSDLERAAKVQILQDSRDYCYQLTHQNETLQRRAQELRRQQERLRLRVSQLRKNLASKR